MKVALDLDGCLACSEKTVARLISEEYGIAYTPAMQYDWSADKLMKHFFGIDMSSEEFLSYFQRAWENWQEIEATSPEAFDTWIDLHQAGFDADIVTYSPDRATLDNKKRWVEAYVSGWPTVVEANNGGWKYDMGLNEGKGYKYDTFVDDCPHIIVGAVARGYNGILFDRPCNRSVDDRYISARVKRADEILPAVEKLREKRA